MRLKKAVHFSGTLMTCIFCAPLGVTNFSNVQAEIHKQASKQLAAFADKYAIAQTDQHIVVGRAETEIHRFAKEQLIDLVVVGSHGRHGLALLLGSTANGVLHGAACDVLAVRVK